MEKQNKKINIFQILQIALIVLVLAFIIMTIVVQLVSPESDLGKWLILNVWDLSKTNAIFNNHIPIIIRSIMRKQLFSKRCFPKFIDQI